VCVDVTIKDGGGDNEDDNESEYRIKVGHEETMGE
jgi:hypothetical protein